MPVKTKKEYETVEKEIEYTECDVPSCFRTDEEYELIELAVNPKYKEQSWDEPSVIKVCESKDEARQMVMEDERHRAEVCPSFLDNIEYAFGHNHKTEIINAKNDAEFFVCQHCLKNHLGVDIEPEKVNEIDTDTKSGGVVVKEEYNPLFSIGNWILLIIIGILLVTIGIMALDFLTVSWAFGL